jgi:hypothetical protein
MTFSLAVPREMQTDIGLQIKVVKIFVDYMVNRTYITPMAYKT